MKIYYGGHSSFMLEEGGHRVLLDPLLLSEAMKIAVPDVIAVTHGHGDHLGSAIDIALSRKVPIMAVFELANYCAEKGAQTLDGHIGGRLKFDFGWIKYVQAFHGSASPDGEYTGNPCGFVVNMSGITVYHTGDTGLFGDMELIASQTPIDVLLCPIGDKYTMGPDDAIKAAALVKPKVIIPMHYNTFPPINQDANKFKVDVEKAVPSVKAQIMKPGDVFDFAG